MSRYLFTAVLVCAFASASPAEEAKFALNGENTTIKFVGSKKDGKHEGEFKKLTGEATIDPADPTTLKVSIEIDVDSITSDDAKLTGHLKSPDFFGVKDNPKATFKSTKVEKTDKGLMLTGDLTMCGKTKSVTMPVVGTVDGSSMTMTSDFKIDRTEWGMMYGKGKINDEVALTITVKAKK